MSHSLDSADVRALVDYNPDTGEMLWRWRPPFEFKDESTFRGWNARYCGKPAGRIHPSGYRVVKYRDILTGVHRLAWVYYHGAIEGEVDHINGIKDDNRIVNLRLVTTAENARNQKLRATNTSGVTGVCPEKGRWRAYIYVRGKCINLGAHDHFNDAVTARKLAEQQYGFHPNHGRAA